MSVVVDASAVFALLADEPGADKVRSVLSMSVMTAVNFSEVVAIYARSGIEAAVIEQSLGELNIEVVPLDRQLAFDTGLLRPICQNAGLSLGDRACLALAKQRHIPALTADRAWLRVAAEVGVEVQLIR